MSTSCIRPARWAAGGAAVLALSLFTAGCDDTTTSSTIQLNLDRPVDVAFACYGGLRLTGGRSPGANADEVITSAQPLASCDHRTTLRATDEPDVPPPGQEDLTATGGAELAAVDYFGLILQSGPGTIALGRFAAKQATTFDGTDVTILDADPLTPGKNSLAVGVRPVAIGVDKTGCFAVTANAGSRDLSVIDVNSVLQLDGQALVTRLTVTNGGMPVKAAPSALVLEPGPALTETGTITVDADAQIGQRCPASPKGVGYVAYPSCHAVAMVNLADGKIQKAIHFDAAGVASIIDPGAAAWPQECGGTAAAVSGPQPTTMDLRYDLRALATLQRRLVIGAANSNQLTVVELDAAARPTSLSQIPLFDATGMLGVLDVALSPHVVMGGNIDPAAPPARTAEIGDGGTFQFAYAVASDGTVRVASTLPAVRRECDTQLDPRFLKTKTTAELACLPLASVAQPRRVRAIGPGIPVPREGVAAAVNIQRIDALVADARTKSTTKLVGTFAVIASTTGATYVADIDDDDKPDVEVGTMPLAVDLATTLPHQLRDQVNERSSEPKDDDGKTLCNSSGPGVDETGGTRGGARLAGAINALSLPEVIADVKRGILPSLQQLLCTGADVTIPLSELAYPMPAGVREDRFPDTQALRSVEDWRVVWEGSLSADTLLSDNNGPPIRQGTLAVAGGAIKMVDGSRPFCSAGVEPFDLVQLRGCDPQATTPQCPVGTKCYVHSDSTSGFGSCLPEKSADQLAETCRPFLVSIRRYGIGVAKSGELTLLPRPRVLRSTPLDGCSDTPQCAELAKAEAVLIDAEHPSLSTATATHQYVCEADPARKAVATGKRCVMTCTRDADCSSGAVCSAGRCMESVLPPAACVAGVQRYELRAGEAFTILGSQSGYIHPIIRNSSDVCVPDPSASKLQVGRIPLTVPACAGDTGPNPCLTEVDQVETAPRYQAGSCTAADPATYIRQRDGLAHDGETNPKAPAIRYRGPGMTFHMVDPYYPGDVCRGDRKGPWRGDLSQTTRPAIPTPFIGFALTFRTGGGYAPLALRTSATVPVKVVRGPQQSIWVVDEGDYLSESTAVPSTRGKVFRIESVSLNTVNVLQ